MPSPWWEDAPLVKAADAPRAAKSSGGGAWWESAPVVSGGSKDGPKFVDKGGSTGDAEDDVAGLQEGLKAGKLRFSDLSVADQNAIAKAESGAVDSTVRGLARGVPFIGSWGDEINSRLNAALGGYAGGSQAGSYDDRVTDNLAYERAKDRVFDKSYPYASAGLQIGGGIAGTLAAAPAAAAEGVAAGAARLGLGLGGKTIPGAIGRGVLAGGLQGAVGAAGDANGSLGDRIAAVPEGAAVGAGVGGLIPAAVGGLGKLGSAAYSAVRGSNDPLANMSPAARRFAVELLGNPDTLARQKSDLSKLGPDAMLSDVSPEWQMIARGAAARPGVRGTVVDALTNRDTGKNIRLGADLDSSLGSAQSAINATGDIRGLRSQEHQVLPGVFEGAPDVDTSNVLSVIGQRLNTAEGAEKTALQHVRDMLMQEKEVPTIGPDGAPVMTAGPATRNMPSAPVSAAKPVELRDFIKRNGGINDTDGDLAAMGLKNLHNPNGMSLDDARRAAAEQGYLGGNIDEAMSGTYTNDLLDALGSERTVHSVFDLNDQAAKAASQYKAGNNGWSRGEPVPLTEVQKVPKTRAENLHNIKTSIDQMINYGDPGLGIAPGALATQQGSLKGVRGLLNETLRDQVPGYAKAMDASSELAGRATALDRGTSLFQPSHENHPALIEQYLAKLTPEQRKAMATGSRAEVDRIAGTNANDPIALSRALRGEGDWSRQNLKQVFGPGADNALNAVDREVQFRNTFNRVTGGSDTAATKGFHEFLSKAERGPIPDVPHDVTLFATMAKGAQRVASVLSSSMGKDRANRYATELARAAISQGVTRDEFISALQRYNVNKGLQERMLKMATQAGLVLSGEARRDATPPRGNPSQ